MEKSNLFVQMRTKKIGILLADAIHSLNKDVEKLSSTTGIPIEKLAQFEKGKVAPSLAELEMLSGELNLPLYYFWGDQLLQNQEPLPPIKTPQEKINKKNMEILEVIRTRKADQNLSDEELGNKCGLGEDDISRLISGEETISLPLLEVISKGLGISIQDLLSSPFKKGVSAEEKKNEGLIENLPDDLKKFMEIPENRSYLELAYSLSMMDKAAIQSIAELLMAVTK